MLLDKIRFKTMGRQIIESSRAHLGKLWEAGVEHHRALKMRIAVILSGHQIMAKHRGKIKSTMACDITAGGKQFPCSRKLYVRRSRLRRDLEIVRRIEFLKMKGLGPRRHEFSCFMHRRFHLTISKLIGPFGIVPELQRFARPQANVFAALMIGGGSGTF